MGLAETADLAIRISLTGNARAGIRGLKGDLGGLSGSIGRVGRGFGQIGTGLARAGLIVGGAAVTGIAAAAKAAIDYEDAFAGVRKTVEASDEQLATLSEQFRELARTIPIPATEFARLGETAGALGIHVSAIDEFVEVTAKLGVTTNLTADEAADALGRIGNILGLTADDYDNFGSALVNLGNKGASTESEIIEITKRFAAAGKQAGLSTTDILGFSEAVASFTGLAPEAAGSSLSRLTGTLTKVVAGGGKKFALLNKIVGEDFKKALDKDAGGALVNFLKGLKGLDKYERASALKTLGLDSVYLRQLLGGLVDNIDDVEASMANADAGWQGNFLNEEAQKKFGTLAQQFKILRNNIFDAGITIGTEFLPALKRTTEKLIGFLQKPGNQAILKSIGRDIGKTIDKIDWAKVLEGARTFVDVMRGALDFALKLIQAIDKLPGELKAAGVGFLALNKLSGGLLGAGIGNVVGGLAETAARAGGSRLPGIGKLFAQPVFVTNWPPTLGAGGAGGAPAAAGGPMAWLKAALLPGLVLGITEAAKNVVNTPEAAAFGIRPLQSNAAPISIAGFNNLLATMDGIRAGIDFLNDPKPVVVKVKPQGMSPDERTEQATQRARLFAIDDRLQAVTDRTRDVKASNDRQTTRIETMRGQMVSATNSARQTITGGGHSDADRIIAAIRSINIPNTRVSIFGIQNAKVTTGTTLKRAIYGTSSGE